MKLDRSLLDGLTGAVVGRRRELEVVAAALHAGRHVLLEGPPGTGKSTLLRSLAEALGVGFEFVEGNAELTPARLVGHYDPSRILSDGYVDDVWVDGPLCHALQHGALLYVEELNRVPEETLNVLITVMSEGELHVPRLGRLAAAPGFRLVAAMNPFDAVGTARISGAIYDRVCRVAMGYQDGDDEVEIVLRSVGDDRSDHWVWWVAKVVEVVRRTRRHAEVRVGSSVRGAIDTVLVALSLETLRAGCAADREIGLDAALAALSGRIRLHEGGSRNAEDIVRELWDQVFAEPYGGPDAGKATSPDRGSLAGRV